MRERDGNLKFNNGEDRVSEYLSMLNKGMLFDELDDNYLKKAGLYDLLKDVAIPVSISESGDMTTSDIALNMGKIIGGDTNFIFKAQYIEYIKRTAGDQAVPMLTAEGAKFADRGEFELAAMYFRAALIIEPTAKNPLYLYGRVCKECYESEDKDETYVGRFKAESLEAFEILTIMHPEFSMGYYFLGYAYLNLGLYMKAKLTWEDFLKYIDEDEVFSREEQSDEKYRLKEDIQTLLKELNDPVMIENGCNLILSGDFQNGKRILENYCNGRYENWWPLWYHLGVAEKSLSNTEDAVEHFKKALVLSPSNTDIMKELADIYEALGDEQNAEKYLKKIDIVNENMAQEICEK